MRARHRPALGLLAALSLAACTRDSGNVDTTCEDSTGCRSGALCVQARCYPTEGPDDDGDGVPNVFEDVFGTDRDRVDTDDDGLDDGVELIYRPRDRVAAAPDSDGDGLPDAIESIVKDADGDGVPDQEDRCNDDPACPGTRDELCNDADDDGDGQIDEAFPDKGLPCALGEGACAADGVVICSPDGKELRCDAEPGAARAETCDGTDDDCDGATDEGFDLGGGCAEGEGRCRTGGVWICGADGARVCDRPAPAVFDETCNGADDDCDGATDEGLLPFCRPTVDHTVLGGHYVDLNVAGRPGELTRGHWGVNRVDVHGEMRWILDGAVNGAFFQGNSFTGDRVEVDPDGRLDWYEQDDFPVWQGGVSSDGRLAIVTNTTEGAVPDLRLLVQPAGAFDATSLAGAYHVAHLRVPLDAPADVRFGQATADGVGTFTLTAARAYSVDGPAPLANLPRAGAFNVYREGDVQVALADAALAGALLDPGGVAFLTGDPQRDAAATFAVLLPQAQAADKDTLRGTYWFVALRVQPATGRLAAVHGRFEAAAGELFFEAGAFESVDGATGEVDWQPEVYGVAPDGAITWRRPAAAPDARLGTGAVSPDGRVAVLTGFEDADLGPSILVAVRARAGEPSGISHVERAFFQSTLRGGASDCVLADCPRDMLALGGGGFWEAGQLDAGPLIDLRGSRSEDVYRWAQCGAAGQAPQPPEWDSRALCAEVAVETTVRTADAVFDGDGPATLTAWCEPGEVLLGGGGSWSAGVDLTALGPAPRGEGWTLGAAGLLPGVAGGGAWQVEAVCARGLPAPRRAVLDATLAANASACVAVDCPADSVVISGGARYPAGVRPDHHQPGDNGWFVCGYVDQDEDAVVELTALCVPGV